MPYSSYAKVAAGGVARDEHQADIEITVSPPDSGVTVPIPSLLADPPPASAANPTPTPENEGAGVNNGDAVVTLDSTTTDNDGKVHGHFHSSNVVRTVTLRIRSGTPVSPNPLPPVVASATIDQVWNELEGSQAAWDYDDFFLTGVASPVTYIMTFENGVPITGHASALQFKTTQLMGLEWDPTIAVDEDGDGVTDYYGDYVDNVSYTDADPELQTGGKYSGLVTYGAATEGANNQGMPNGHYTADQTINDYPSPDDPGAIDYYVDDVEFDILDYDAYQQPPPGDNPPP